MSENKSKNDIIIMHDTFLYKWWWERLILMMAKALKSDLASGFFSKWSFDLRTEWFNWKLISVSSEIYKKWFRHIKLKLAFLFNTKFLKNYKTVIFSWDSISSVRNCWKDTKKIYYCHTPPRYLYDLRELYSKKVPYILRPIFSILSYIFKKMYESDISKMDLILTNSINTQKRIKLFLGLDSTVLYPPVNLEEFRFLWQKDYYLSFARLSSVKRVDKVAQAFTKMPDKKLIIIYWENDPEYSSVFDIVEWYKNIEMITLYWNKWFTEYVWNCIATIYIPVDEDFWMSPVESMAAWKPVLWVNDWWLKESLIDKKTWVLIKTEASIEDIIAWVNYLSVKRSLEMQIDCENRAKDFSLWEFETKLKKLVFIK